MSIDEYVALASVIRESYGRVVYTHKAHEKDADRLATHASTFRWVQIILLVATTGGAVTALLGETHVAIVITAILASLSLFIELVNRSFRLEQEVAAHRRAASLLWPLRERYIELLSDLTSGSVSALAARQIRDELTQHVGNIYDRTIATTPSGYKAAQLALKVGTELTFSDAEIDSFLPRSLHVS